MEKLAGLMSVYQRYHTKESTKYTHMAGIPIVLFSVFVFLSWFHLLIPNYVNISFMWLAVIASSIYYLLLDWMIGAAMVVFMIILGILVHLITGSEPSAHAFKIFLITFIFGWILQFIGHFLEGKKPALFDNLFQSIVGPIFIMAEVFFMCGLRKDLQDDVLARASYGNEMIVSED